MMHLRETGWMAVWASALAGFSMRCWTRAVPAQAPAEARSPAVSITAASRRRRHPEQL